MGNKYEELLNEHRLSPTETRILEVALDPSFHDRTLQDKCAAANVAKNTWYRAMSDDDFVRVLNKLSIDLVSSKVADLINASYKYAVSNAKNAQDRKMLLTMAGAYVDKQETKIEHTGSINNPLKDLSIEEIKELLNKKEENEEEF